MFGLGKKKPEDIRVEPELEAQPGRRRTRQGFAPYRSRNLDAGSTDRLTQSWATTPLSADDIINRHQRVVVARSREQAANNDYAKSFIRRCRLNVVGPKGVQLQAQVLKPRGGSDAAVNQAIEEAFQEWGRAENCDVTGKRSLRQIQKGLIQTAAKDGEFIFRIVVGEQSGPWGIALQTIDPQRCPVDFHEERRRDGTFIRQGIEYNRYGRPLAFYFDSTDEIEINYRYGGRQFHRVPADQIVHGFVEDMDGQKRGLPWMSTALWRLQMLGGFEKAALVNARVSASKGGFFEWDEGYGPEADEDEEILIDAEPGQFQELPAGVRFKPWDPQYPSGEFAPFHKSLLRGIASGLGAAYNGLANDLEGVNFSSIRQGAIDEREFWKDLQEWFIEAAVQKIYDAWLPIALLSGRIKLKGQPIPATRIEAYRRVSWQPVRWPWIDPKSDVKANIDAKNNLLTSPGQIIRDQGRDPDQVWREVAADIEKMKSAGIPDQFIQAAIGLKLGGSGDVEANELPDN